MSTRRTRKRKAGEVADLDGVAHTAKKAKVSDKSSDKATKSSRNAPVHLSPRLNIKNATLGACGSNDMLQLGLQIDGEIRSIRVILKDVTVYDIRSAGAVNVAAVEKDGEKQLLTWGSNDCCALGRPTVKNSEDNKDQILPAPVPFFTGKEVVQVSCGDAHMAALLSDGTMYNWGVYRDASGVLGFTYGKEKPQLDPVKIEINESIVQIASADNSTLALTKSGHIYIWGAYRLLWRTSERTNAKISSLNPSRVLTSIKFNKIAAGGMHFFARSVDGRWYSWGINNWGQLGQGHAPQELDREGIEAALQEQIAENSAPESQPQSERHNDASNFVASPKLVKWPEGIGNVIEIEAGQHHSIAMTDTGKILGFGRNSYGQLGWGQRPTFAHTPTLIPFFEKLGERVVSIACGEHSTYVITSKGGEERRAWAFGFNASGQLGLGNEEDDEVYEPKELVRSESAKQRGVWWVHIVGGGTQHNIFINAPPSK